MPGVFRDELAEAIIRRCRGLGEGLRGAIAPPSFSRGGPDRELVRICGQRSAAWKGAILRLLALKAQPAETPIPSQAARHEGGGEVIGRGERGFQLVAAAEGDDFVQDALRGGPEPGESALARAG